MGDNILTADLARVRDMLAEEPWVKDATVQRVFPDRLVAHVVEHTAVAVEAHSGQLIDESGRIIRVSVERGVSVPELEAACINAVLRWNYRPAQENGVAVKAWTTAEFSF